MGKQSKAKKRSIVKMRMALKGIIKITQPFFNTTKFKEICSIAKKGLS